MKSDWVKRDLNCIWHPFTQMKDCETLPPVLIKKAKGIKLYDERGNYYYDTISSWWCNNLGHNVKQIKNAINKTLKKIDHVLLAGFTHENAIILAEKLIDILPDNLKKVFYSDNGSTAVEVALKISYQYWQNIGKNKKREFVSFDYGYHGDTLGAMSVSGESIFNRVFSDLFFKSHKVKSPYCYRCPLEKRREECKIECISFVEEILDRNSERIAAVIIEPLIFAAGGMIVYPEEYLKKLYELTKRCNVHLILDEIATGFGRTGKMFAVSQTEEVKPDIVCLSKGLTAGTLPLGVTAVTDQIYNAFYDDYEKFKTFFHGHTFTGNPIATSAAIATIDFFKKYKVIEKAKGKIEYFHNKLYRFKELSCAGDVRKLGFIGAIELVKDREKKEPYSIEERIGLKVFKEGLKRALILRPLGNVIYFFLPLTIKEKEIDYITDTTFDILSKL